MKRKTYVAPETEMRTVELEQGFMQGSIDPEKSEVTSNQQEIEGEYTFGEDDESIWN